MIVKIYLPNYLYYRKEPCELYGEVVIEEKSVSYFIISDEARDSDLRVLGHVSQLDDDANIQRDNSIIFGYRSSDQNISLVNLSVQLTREVNVNLFLYDQHQLRCIEDQNAKDPADIAQNGDVCLLRSLVRQEEKTSRLRNSFEFCVEAILRLLGQCFLGIGNAVERIRVLRKIAAGSTLGQHSKIWRKHVMQKGFHSGHLWTIMLDITLGIVISVGLLYLNNPSKYIIRLSNTIILQLRTLLDSLKGSPVGLKLNVQLNNFFLDCFVYHVDLWATFLVLVSPLIQYLFVPVVILGFFGLSFQLAMLTDVVVFTSLHAQCFYIYAAVLYHVEIVGFRTLWKVVLGKRKNVLKGRVESHDYMNRQLFLATLFFAILLFLFPTVIVYYVVFAFLRTCIYFFAYTLMLCRKFILSFPIRSIIMWILGRHLTISNININLLGIAQPPLHPVYVFSLDVRKSSLMGTVKFWKIVDFDKYLSIDQYLLGIFKGQMMGFTLPKVVDK